MECQQLKNKADCSCTYDCSRHGKCCDCLQNHRDVGEFPACFFTPKGEKTRDRSWQALQKYYRYI